MKDVFDAVSARIKAPYVGYAVLAFIAWNWRALFMLVMTGGTPDQRLLAFDSHTNLWRLYIAPLATGLLVAASAEWMSFCFAWISRRPIHWKEMYQLKAEHQKTIAIADLDKLRDERFSRKEEELIARAKRDEKVKEIENDELKRKLEEDLDSLRNEQDKNEDPEEVEDASLPSFFAQKLLRAAAELDGRIVKVADGYGKRIRAGALELAKEEQQREYSRYETALRELASRGLVQEEYEGVYEITEDGWQFLDFSKETWVG